MRFTCRDATANAHDLIDGGLPFGARLATRGHLLICRDCRTHLGQVRSTRRLIAAAARRAGDPSTAFATALAARAVAARVRHSQPDQGDV